jgi:hypothetical protein
VPILSAAARHFRRIYDILRSATPGHAGKNSLSHDKVIFGGISAFVSGASSVANALTANKRHLR